MLQAVIADHQVEGFGGERQPAGIGLNKDRLIIRPESLTIHANRQDVRAFIREASLRAAEVEDACP
jgi:hypothetical protein